MNGTYQFLVYAYDVNLLGKNACIIERNTEILLVASKGVGLELNAQKTRYVGEISNIWEQP